MGRPRTAREFLLAYPEAGQDLAARFAQACSDPHGRGLVSLTMLYDHFKRHPGAPDKALEKVEEQMTKVERVEPEKPEPPPEPTDFVATWLKENELGQYVQNFLGQGFSTKESLEVFPLTDE